MEQYERDMVLYEADPTEYNRRVTLHIWRGRLSKPGCALLPLWVVGGWIVAPWYWWIAGIAGGIAYLWIVEKALPPQGLFLSGIKRPGQSDRDATPDS